jgi:hypothetical protein
MHSQFYSDNSKRLYNLGDKDIDGRIMLKLILNIGCLKRALVVKGMF